MNTQHDTGARARFRHLGAIFLLATALLGGCTAVPHKNPNDPYEPFNRSMTRFNDAVDGAVLKPAATAYQAVTPALVRTGVSNFFGNLSDAWAFVNNTLQLKGQAAAESFMRFSFNTIFGFAGVLDIAGEFGIEHHYEDFGQTLAFWGVPAGPYLVLPLLGPSTVRDALVLPIEAKGNLVSGVNNDAARNSLYVLEALETRANLLRASAVLDEAALDKYSFTRDIFLQRRRAAIFDGNPPPEPESQPPSNPAGKGATPATAPASAPASAR